MMAQQHQTRGVLRRKCACGTCPKCQEEQTELRRRAAAPETERAEVPGVVHEVLRGPGRPLDLATGEQMRARFGRDFRDVRVHTDARAAESARAVNAAAYTVGNHVVVDEGRQRLHTPAGQHLLAHELVHTTQQSPARPGGELVVGPTDSPQEREADAVASAAMSGRVGALFAPAATAADGQLQRFPSWKEITDTVKANFCTSVGDCLTVQWHKLAPETKATIANWLLTKTNDLIELFPKEGMGVLWPVFRAGLRGFFGALLAADDKVKVAALDKIANIVGGRDPEYTLAFLKGFLRGFIVDGLFGPVVALVDLAGALPEVWKVLRKLGEAIEGLPDDMEGLLTGFENLTREMVEQAGPAITELVNVATDPKRAQALLGGIGSQVEELAQQGGAKIASVLLTEFTKPGASAAIGNFAGNAVGQITFEAVAAAFTGGGSTVAAGAKTTIRKFAGYLREIVAKAAKSFLAVFREAVALIEGVVEVVRGVAKMLKDKAMHVLGVIGEKIGKLLDDVKAFFGKLLGNCHESKITCPTLKSGKKGAAKPAPPKPTPTARQLSNPTTPATREQVARFNRTVGPAGPLRKADGGVLIKNVVSDPAPRLGLEKQLREIVDLPAGFDASHSQGASLGNEMRAGIFGAHYKVNRSLMRRVETKLEFLHKTLKGSGKQVLLTTESHARPGTALLHTIDYRAQIIENGKVAAEAFEVTIEVGKDGKFRLLAEHEAAILAGMIK